MTTLSYDPTHCTLCPRRCGADRTQAKGRCRMPDAPVVARAALHHWEEPPLSGTQGAGTVFSAAFSARTTASAKMILVKPSPWPVCGRSSSS